MPEVNELPLTAILDEVRAGVLSPRDAWLRVLDEEIYPQDRCSLKATQGYCCLGVGCDLYRRVVGGVEWDAGDEFIYSLPQGEGKSLSEINFAPPPVAKWLELPLQDVDTEVSFLHELHETTGSDLQQVVAFLNDAGATFPQIAAFLRRPVFPQDGDRIVAGGSETLAVKGILGAEEIHPDDPAGHVWEVKALTPSGCIRGFNVRFQDTPEEGPATWVVV